jgi:hypothetical protein
VDLWTVICGLNESNYCRIIILNNGQNGGSLNPFLDGALYFDKNWKQNRSENLSISFVRSGRATQLRDKKIINHFFPSVRSSGHAGRSMF